MIGEEKGEERDLTGIMGEVAGLGAVFILRLCLHSNECTYLARKLIGVLRARGSWWT